MYRNIHYFKNGGSSIYFFICFIKKYYICIFIIRIQRKRLLYHCEYHYHKFNYRKLHIYIQLFLFYRKFNYFTHTKKQDLNHPFYKSMYYIIIRKGCLECILLNCSSVAKFSLGKLFLLLRPSPPPSPRDKSCLTSEYKRVIKLDMRNRIFIDVERCYAF